MTSSGDDSFEFDVLASRSMDSVLSDSEHARLDRQLAGNPDLARRFLQLARLHAGLKNIQAESPADPLVEAGSAPKNQLHLRPSPVRAVAQRRRHRSAQILRRPKRRPWIRYGVIPLAGAAALLLVFYLINVVQVKKMREGLTARVIEIKGGDVELIWAGRAVPVRSGSAVEPGARVRTGKSDSVTLQYPDRTTVTLKAGSEMTLGESKGAKRLWLDRGEIFVDVTKQPRKAPMRVTTPNAAVLVLGTKFRLSATTDATRLEVAEGRVQFTRLKDRRSIKVDGGHYAVVEKGTALVAKPVAKSEVAAKAAFVPAFPGAEGFGAKSVGGRGGKIIEVTNLNDSGPGSYRAAVEASGPRIVVFRVGGTIELKGGMGITNPYITIAGQTAPGGGIALKFDGEFIIKRTHDVVLRHVRFRHTGKRKNGDALQMYGAHNIILDHCSVSWGTDETLSVIAKSHDVTIQWWFIYRGLMAYGHSMGSLFSSGVRNLSIHHNLYAHHSERLPKMKGYPDRMPPGKHAYFDFVNNVIYNWGKYATAVAGSGKANVVANYFKRGPNSRKRRVEILLMQHEEGRRLYAANNVGPSCPNGCPNDYTGGMVSDISGRLKTVKSPSYSATRIPAPLVTTTSAKKALEQVLADVGATRPMRDAVDQRLVNDVKNGTGRIIDYPKDVGGWPALASGTPYTDSDHDGMPDDWEKRHGLNPADPSDGPRDADGDGYTNIEEFLNGTDPKVWKQ